MRTPKNESTANSAKNLDSQPVDPKAKKNYDDDDDFDEQIDDLGFDDLDSFDDEDDF